MKRSGVAWALAGVVAGLAGIAVDYALASLWNQQHALAAVAGLVRDTVPGPLENWGRENNGKAITIPIGLALVVVLFAVVGRATRRFWWAPVAGYGVVALLGTLAVLDATAGQLPQLVALGAGYAVSVVAMTTTGERLRRVQDLDDEQAVTPLGRTRRRDFLTIVGVVAAVAGVSTVVGRFAGRGRRAVQDERAIARLPVTSPSVPQGARVDARGVRPWMTPVEEFYLIDTSFSRPRVLARDWQLRIHGLVDAEITLTFDDLLQREVTEDWITLNCVSNEVGGGLIGNAWWSGVRLAPLLAEAGVQDGADCVLQTSVDGWDCSTPLAALTDDRNAMLAVAMNGEALTIEHGYPVRTIVPGLYGYVSGTKWVVDMEVTRFADVEAYWTQRGWGEMGPVKIASRVDVPAEGAELPAGEVVVAGSAWMQHTGIEGVEVQVDGGPWTAAELGTVPDADTWVQWRATADLAAGEHTVTVRAVQAGGEVQTSAVADVLPDGATGLHSVTFTTS
ncbi:molybdopterin-dependent oxidoreductase [Nocardioides litoris]|uniref:molybdopterin-dependent oxidoreductase n=1 Tax=Nocardioides litoris TaxID=1926648 RepID=UPI0011241433|nr:molybdopterin-dependent oxidoreductase [Nocardioides litoris]